MDEFFDSYSLICLLILFTKKPLSGDPELVTELGGTQSRPKVKGLAFLSFPPIILI